MHVDICIICTVLCLMYVLYVSMITCKPSAHVDSLILDARELHNAHLSSFHKNVFS